MKILLVFLSLIPLTARAQNFAALRDDTNVVTVQTGADYSFVLGGGYARVTSVADRQLVLGGDVTLGLGGVDVSDFRLRTGALVPLVDGERWKVVGGLAVSLRGTNNGLGRMTNAGTDVALLAGRYAHRGFIAAELGFDWALATHVSHGDTYRMNAYADARDGWYRSTGAMLRAGVQAGLTLARHDVILRVGRLVDVSGSAPLFPIYGTLAFDTRW
jgi:hypothetical protein